MPDSNFRPTREELLRAAFRRIGQQNPSVSQMAIGAFSLNLWISTIDDEGQLLWTYGQTPASLTTVIGQASYATGNGASLIPIYIQDLEKAFLARTNQWEPLDVYNKDEATGTYLREDTGEPVAVHLEQAANPADNKLWIFPTPSAVYSLKLHYRRMLYDADDAAEGIDFPRKWFRTAILGTAQILAGDFGAPDLGDIITEYDREFAKSLKSTSEKKRTSRIKIRDF